MTTLQSYVSGLFIMKACCCLVLCLLVAVFSSAAFARTLAEIEIDLPRANSLYVPVSISLNDLGDTGEAPLLLFDITDKRKTPVPFQVYGDEKRRLYWLVTADDRRLRRYQLVSDKKAHRQEPVVTSRSQDGVLTIEANRQHLLAYQFGFQAAPEGMDPAYGRSAYIHPLWSPRGQVLTRIQPPDHYHHYGIWNPWTQVLFEGRKIDFWNLAQQQGSVRFGKFIAQTHGSVFAEFKALHEHIVFTGDGQEKIAFEEIQTIRVYRPEQQEYYLVDMTVELFPTAGPITLLEYRYGGFGWRATAQWNRHNSEMLSSEGKTRADIDNSRGRWFLAQGRVDGDHAGVAMLSHPGNFNHPEPMRMWGLPEDPQDPGDVFASFSPTRDRDWTLIPGQTYTRHYRFIVYSGKLDAGRAENAWQFFSTPPATSLTGRNNP